MIELLVNNKEIKAAENTNLLKACLDNNIYIPNLCYIDGLDLPNASCRLCLVEIEGEKAPVCACTVNVRKGLVVKTDTPAVRRLQCTAMHLLLSVHHVDCGHCPANKTCELQRMSKFLGVALGTKRFEKHLKKIDIDEASAHMNYDPNRCVLCGKCVTICKKKQNQPAITFAKRGLETIISFYSEQQIDHPPCINCRACIEICPVSAITPKQLNSDPKLSSH